MKTSYLIMLLWWIIAILAAHRLIAVNKELDSARTQLQQEKILYHECYDENYELSQQIEDLKGYIEQTK